MKQQFLCLTHLPIVLPAQGIFISWEFSLPSFYLQLSLPNIYQLCLYSTPCSSCGIKLKLLRKAHQSPLLRPVTLSPTTCRLDCLEIVSHFTACVLTVRALPGVPSPLRCSSNVTPSCTLLLTEKLFFAVPTDVNYHSHCIIDLRAFGLLSCSPAFLRTYLFLLFLELTSTGTNSTVSTESNSFLNYFKCSQRNNNYLVIFPPGTGGFYYHAFHEYFKHLYFKPYHRFPKFSFDDNSTWLCY